MGYLFTLFTLFASQTGCLDTRKAVPLMTLEVIPSHEMAFKLNPSLHNSSQVCGKQVALYQALSANRKLFDATTLRVVVQEQSVTISSAEQDDSQAPKQLAAATKAMEQIFGQKGFTASGNGAALSRADADTRRRVIEILTQRFKRAGIRGVSLQAQGDRDITLLAKPGRVDPQQLKPLFVQALLEFRLLPVNYLVSEDTASNTLTVTSNGKALTDAEVIRNSYQVMTGDQLSPDCDVDTRMSGQPAVSFALAKKEAQDRFAEVTGHNVGHYLAIVIDGKIISAPVIQARIQGNGIIAGGFTIARAKHLALLLNAGALPAPIRVISAGSTPGK